jgi:alpha-1,3-mannosyl-glycoprotein beta-1,2-N-acetylglucosaminyltransferase
MSFRNRRQLHKKSGNDDNNNYDEPFRPVKHYSNTQQNGVSKPSLFAYRRYSTTGIVIFRAAITFVILLCLLWGGLIIKIAKDIQNDEIENNRLPRGVIVRPKIGHENRLFGKRLRQRIKRLEQRLEHRAPPLLDIKQMDSPVLVFTFKRADYFERSMWKLYEHHPAQKFVQKANKLRQTSNNVNRIMGSPVIISQDGNDPEVKAVIDAYREAFEINLGVPLYRIEHYRAPDEEKDINVDPWNKNDTKPYIDLAKHYGWALEQTFSGASYDLDDSHRNQRVTKPPLPNRVIILEEDIEIGRDFFSFMNATADLLDNDDSLLAVSGYNDNGKKQIVADVKRVVRSDFFPGLGWMMPRRVWFGVESHPNSALRSRWAPNGYWDDWMREPDIRLGRQVLRPEVSRTFHFGNIHGVSQTDVRESLNQVELDRVDVQWEKEDLSYLSPERFAESYWGRVSNAKLVSSEADAKYYIAHGDVRLNYDSQLQFESFAMIFGIMSDEKAGVPRTAFEGIVEIRYGKGDYIVFLTPPYVSESGQRPSTFGKKAWTHLDKPALLESFGLLTSENWQADQDWQGDQDYRGY